MSSENISLQNRLGVFQDGLAAFNCAAAQSGPKTRDLTGFIDDKLFSFPASQSSEFRGGNVYDASASDRQDPRNTRSWGNGGRQHSGEESDAGDDDDDEEEDDGDDDDGDGEDHNNNNSSNNNNSAGESVGKQIIPRKNASGKAKHHSSFLSREAASKGCNYQNAVTVAEPDGDMYYSHYMTGSGGVGGGQKDAGGFSGRKDASFSSESGESLRTILSDPVT